MSNLVGKPAELHDEMSPDWAPSMKMGYGTAIEGNLKDLTSRYDRSKARKRRKVMDVIEGTLKDKDDKDEVNDEPDKSVCGKNKLHVR